MYLNCNDEISPLVLEQDLFTIFFLDQTVSVEFQFFKSNLSNYQKKRNGNLRKN